MDDKSGTAPKMCRLMDGFRQVDKMLLEREAGSVWLKKVAGHATDRAVEAGQVLWEDKQRWAVFFFPAVFFCGHLFP